VSGLQLYRDAEGWHDQHGIRYRIDPDGTVWSLEAGGKTRVARMPELAEPAQVSPLDTAISTIVESLKSGGTVFCCGNGGSDAHAGHLAAELIGRFGYDRPPLRAIHLPSGGPVGSCIANDYGFGEVFARQVRALCGEHERKVWTDGGNDVLVCFTTSGKSVNVHQAIRAAMAARAAAVAFTGPKGLMEFSDVDGYDDGFRPMRTDALIVRADAFTTAMIQEEHQRQIHEVARRVEEALCPRT
jgi:D-sedoheptulose 7-phosphate isomerase